jgi:hypothetical protein
MNFTTLFHLVMKFTNAWSCTGLPLTCLCHGVWIGIGTTLPSIFHAFAAVAVTCVHFHSWIYIHINVTSAVVALNP